MDTTNHDATELFFLQLCDRIPDITTELANQAALKVLEELGKKIEKFEKQYYEM